MYGNPETTTGGRALKFYASVRLEIRKAEAIKVGNELMGNSVNVKVVKNKVAAPYKVASVDIIYGKGISKEGEVIDLAADYGIIKKAGAWYEYNGVKIAQGREAAKAWLLSHEAEREEITESVKAQINSK